MIWFTQGSLIVWPIVVLFVFERQSIQRAIVTSFVAAWLFLPPIRLDMPGLPDWSKTTATTIGVLVAVLMKQPQRLLAFRPRWFDLPILGFCGCSLLSSLTMGLGVYEGLSSVLDEIVRWGLPYLLGRVYLGDGPGCRQLNLGMVIGGVLYMPFCLLEIRLSPVLKMWVYGMTDLNTAEFGLRYGGYRPSVFLNSGLEVGWWMCCATLCAALLVSSRGLRRLFQLPAVPVAWALGLVTVLCKSTGALVQLGVGLALIVINRWTKTSLLFWVLLLIAPVYCATRSLGYCSGQTIGTMASQVFAAERIQSLEYRFIMEDRLIAAAWQHPLLGWTRSGGFNPADEQGRTMAVTDGYWIMTFCCTGYVGLALLNAMLLLPSALFLGQYPVRTWGSPTVAPLLALATILPLFMIDNLSNAMLNPIYAIAMGVVSSCADRRGAALRAGLVDQADDAAADHPAQHAARLSAAIADQAQLVRARPLGRHVARLAQLQAQHARVLAEQGQADQAQAQRTAAEEVWRSLDLPTTDHQAWPPERLANANDLVWRLASRSPAEPARLSQARRLIEVVTQVDPTQAPFWNTLGLVCLRQADYHHAIQAVSRSVTLGADGGTAFDFYVLALANSALGYHQVAATWLSRAEGWRQARPDWDSLLEPLRSEALRAQPVPEG